MLAKLRGNNIGVGEREGKARGKGPPGGGSRGMPASCPPDPTGDASCE